MASVDLRKDLRNYIDHADDKLLRMIKALVEIYHEDSERISVEQYNRELQASEAQIERGEFFTHEEMGERIKKWAKK